MFSFIPIESHLKARGFNLIAGMDEAGRGPLAGPIVSAVVILQEKADLPGLKDSKLLSAKKREQLFKLILENSIDYSISIVSHGTIDKINITNATRVANELCIRSLKSKPDIALIDGRDKQIFKMPFLNIIKGDSKVRCIAAASILAKVMRDAIMRHYAKKYPKYGFHTHMGYGTRVHRANLCKFGLCDIHRKSYNYKPTN